MKKNDETIVVRVGRELKKLVEAEARKQLVDVSRLVRDLLASSLQQKRPADDDGQKLKEKLHEVVAAEKRNTPSVGAPATGGYGGGFWKCPGCGRKVNSAMATCQCGGTRPKK